jgi:ABC-type nitrate/sulfonate/bicarbonate transport system ATPase subunit
MPANALVFQEHGLFPWMPVLANVAFGLEMRGIAKAERQQRALAFLETIGLADFARSYPHELSMGMRQRVAIARAFLTDPRLLLMDEPFNALDSQIKLLLQEELLRIWKLNRKMVLYVTHDIDEAVLLGDRVLVMSGRPGRIIDEIEVPLERPRDLRDREAPEFRRLTWRVWERIETEVRRGLRLPG